MNQQNNVAARIFEMSKTVQVWTLGVKTHSVLAASQLQYGMFVH
jgi:hypothetical protein